MKPSYFSIFFTNECYFLAWSEHTLNLQNKNRGTKFDLVFSRLHLFLQTLSASSSSSSPSYFCFPWMGNEQQQKWNKSMKDSVGGGERNLTRVRSTCRWPQNTTSPEISRIFAIVYRSQLKFQCFIFSKIHAASARLLTPSLWMTLKWLTRLTPRRELSELLAKKQTITII